MLISRSIFVFLSLASKAQGLEVWNTFEDSIISGGVEALFQYVGPTFISDEVEFPLFPKFFPPMKGDPSDGMYDIDITENSIDFTLIDGSGGTDIVIPEGRFDRYYFDLDFAIEKASVMSSNDINVELTVVPPGGLTDGPIDLFGLGLETPKFIHGGLILSIEAGSDLTESGQGISIDYTLREYGRDPEAFKAYLMMTAQAQLTDTRERIIAGLPLDQVDCFRDTDGKSPRYFFCTTVPTDIEESTYIIHERVPTGHKLKFFKEEPEIFPRMKALFTSLKASIDGCTDFHIFKLGTYEWVNKGQRVTRTVLLTSFMADTNPYLAEPDTSNSGEQNIERVMCGFNAISEVEHE